MAAVSVDYQFMPLMDYQKISHTSHVCEFLATSFEVVTVFGLHGILNSTWYWVVDTQYGALHELDFASCVSLQP